VVRKVTPLTAKKNLLVAHDHHRGGIRSFDIGAIQNIQTEDPTPIPPRPGVQKEEKTPFWKGFMGKMKSMFT